TYGALRRELNAIGTNINQIAHNTNARKEAGQTDIDEAVKLVRQAYRLIKEAL
ncbi:MAG: MobC family plasmid mobilization relaxosome protein, partial [Oscillospiraceae bacterium]